MNEVDNVQMLFAMLDLGNFHRLRMNGSRGRIHDALMKFAADNGIDTYDPMGLTVVDEDPDPQLEFEFESEDTSGSAETNEANESDDAEGDSD